MTYSDVQTALVPSMRGYLGYRPFPCQLLQQCIDITLYGGSVLWGSSVQRVDGSIALVSVREFS